MIASTPQSRGLCLPAMTVNEWTERWLIEQQPKVIASTFRARCSFIRAHVTPVIGSMLMTDVLQNDIRRILQSLAADDLAPNTIRVSFFTLNALFRDARRARVIAVNPCVRAPVPPRQKTAPFVWDAKRLRAQIDVLQEHPLRDCATLAIGSAFRPIEIYDLRASAYDQRGPWLTVSHVSRYAIAPRRIALPQFAAEAVERLVVDAKLKHSVFMVSDAEGKQYTAASFSLTYTYWLGAAQDVPSRRFWDLRHAFDFLARRADLDSRTMLHYTRIRPGIPSPSDAELLRAAAKLESAWNKLLAENQATEPPNRQRVG